MSRSRSWSAHTAAVARMLYDSPTTPVRQADLATTVGITQPAVSQILRRFEQAQAIRRIAGGRLPTGRLPAVYAERYRPPRTSRYWYHLDPLPVQVAALVEHLPHIVFTGDIAADLIAAWRTPTIISAYASEPLDLEPFDFVPAAGPYDATVIVHTTTDPTLIDGARPVGTRSVAHDLDVYSELVALGGEDRIEAANRIVERILQ
jgi:hypothetical protein